MNRRKSSAGVNSSAVLPSNNSRLGLWNSVYAGGVNRAMYDDITTARVAGAYLSRDCILTVEDWGCGLGGFKEYIGAWQDYIGIDGSRSPYADCIADLEKYTSNSDSVHMRHVLEHNPQWEQILYNALCSFRKRMVLTLFTPFNESTQIIARYKNFCGTGVEMIDLGFSRDDIVNQFDDLHWFSIENIRTDTQYGIEHMFFIEK